MPITPSCQSAPATAYARRARLLRCPLVHLRDRLADDAPLDGLPLLVELLERFGEPAGFVSSSVRSSSSASRGCPSRPAALRRGASRNPTVPASRPAGIDSGRAHERTQPRLRRSRERAEAGDREGAVLVDKRDDVGDRRERHEIEVPLGDLRIDAEERLAELVHDAGSAELRERIVGRPRRDDRTIGKRLGGTVMVGDDHVEAARGGFGDLTGGRDAAVDGQDEPAAFVGEPRERVAADAVALVEAAREMPVDVGAELAQQKDGERGRRDPVDVVVAVDADALACGDRRAEAFARGLHVTEAERIVRRLLALEEAACRRRGRDSRDARGRPP